jgi:dTDP-4-dehydrorhamnose reductase
MMMADTNTSSRRSLCYHVILTGASGYLGQHLLHDFIANNTRGFFAPFDNDDTTAVHIHALYGGNTPGFVEAVQRHYSANDDAHQQQTTAVVVKKSPKNVLVQVEALDLTDANAVQAWMVAKEDESSFLFNKNPVVCIHTAALSNPRACQKDTARAHALNVPKAFLDACTSRGVAMICLSTDQVYAGTCPPYIEDDTTTTTTTTDDDDETRSQSRRRPNSSPVNVYGATKLAMEQFLLLQNYFNSSSSISSKVIVLRSSIILGRKAPILPEHAHDTFLHFCASRKGMDTDFYTDERRSVVSVDDVIASIQWFVRDCLHHQHEQQVSPPIPTTAASTTSSTTDIIRKTTTTTTNVMIFNMGGPTSVSRFDMAKAVFEHLGYDPVHLIAKEKRLEEEQPNNEQVPPSPLDISMDSKKIETITGRTFESLSSMVQKTFSTTTT